MRVMEFRTMSFREKSKGKVAQAKRQNPSSHPAHAFFRFPTFQYTKISSWSDISFGNDLFCHC